MTKEFKSAHNLSNTPDKDLRIFLDMHKGDALSVAFKEKNHHFGEDSEGKSMIADVARHASEIHANGQINIDASPRRNGRSDR